MGSLAQTPRLKGWSHWNLRQKRIHTITSKPNLRPVRYQPSSLRQHYDVIRAWFSCWWQLSILGRCCNLFCICHLRSTAIDPVHYWSGVQPWWHPSVYSHCDHHWSSWVVQFGLREGSIGRAQSVHLGSRIIAFRRFCCWSWIFDWIGIQNRLI